MDQEYDAIVLGTGLKECIISGILSVEGHKVLHIDRNSYYGGASASLNLNQLFERFLGKDAKPPESLGASRDYNIDMAPKFIMANGNLVRTLVHTDVTKYLDFKAVDGSFVYVFQQAGFFSSGGGKIHKVPATDMEALKSPLMGLLEKRRAKNFFVFVQNYDADDPRTHNGLDLTRMSMAELFAHFALDQATVDFVGHSIALWQDERYLRQPAIQTVPRIKLYHDSLLRFEGLKSPYIYPLYGLGELPQGFARLSAVFGGTYMLDRPDAEVVFEAGKAVGVKVEGEVARCKFVVGDPTYFPDKVQTVSRVVRCMCIMSHPVPNTDDAHSCQVIIPQRQVNRQSDIYIFACSYAHHVAPQGKWLAFVSTTVETSNPEQELAPGLALLGPVDCKFVEVTEVKEPTNVAQDDGCYISKGYDATSHFESTINDVLDMYKRITGKELDLHADKPMVQQSEM
ncbi:unnamed protein product [Pedinophyceae sp. YPF-701]|nr:unnamed protein product [Pedinophyceae sp. YPF-701]